MARISHDERTGTIRIAPARLIVNSLIATGTVAGASTLLVNCLFNRTAFAMPADTPVPALIFVGIVLLLLACWTLSVLMDLLWGLFGSETITIDKRSVRIRRSIFGKSVDREFAFNTVLRFAFARSRWARD